MTKTRSNTVFPNVFPKGSGNDLIGYLWNLGVNMSLIVGRLRATTYPANPLTHPFIYKIAVLCHDLGRTESVGLGKLGIECEYHTENNRFKLVFTYGMLRFTAFFLTGLRQSSDFTRKDIFDQTLGYLISSEMKNQKVRRSGTP